MAPVFCHLTSVHQPFDTRIFHKECRSLAAAGYAVYLAAPAAFTAQEREGVRIVGVPPPARRWQRPLTWWRLYRVVWRLRPAVIHLHDPELLLLGVWCRLVHRTRAVYDAHEYVADDILDKPWVPAWLRRPLARVMDGVEKRAARALNAVVVVNDHMAGLFRPWQQRVATVANYPLVNPAPPAPPDVARVPEVVYVGGINRERGLGLLMAALERLTGETGPVRCTLVGPVDACGVDAGLLERLQASGTLRLAGTVPHDEVAGHLAPHTIGVIPWLPLANNVLGTPTKLFEYMVAGAPVVAPDYGFMAEIVRDAGCGLLYTPGDAASLAAALRRLLENPAEARRLGANGAAAVRTKYNWATQEQNLLALYAELTAAVKGA